MSLRENPLGTQEGGSHYKDFEIQPVEFITKNGIEFAEGCVIKYVCRHEKKNGVEDIDKAIHFLNIIKELKYGRDTGFDQSKD